MLALVVFALTADPFQLTPPLNFDSLSVELAKTFNNKTIAVSFLVAKPSYTLQGFTII